MPVALINLLKGRPRTVLRRVLVDVSAAMSQILDAPKARLVVWIPKHEQHLRALDGAPADEALARGSLAELEAPFVQMALMQGRPKERLHTIIAAATDVLARALVCDRKRIRVQTASGDPDGWGVGGTPARLVHGAEIAARASKRA